MSALQLCTNRANHRCTALILWNRKKVSVKKFISLLLVFSFGTSLFTSAFAAPQTSSGNAQMDAFIVDMFETDGYQVIKNGCEDVTETFFKETTSAYLSGDFKEIVDYMFANELSAYSPDSLLQLESNARSRYQVVQCHKGGVELVDELIHGYKSHNYIIWDLYSNVTYDSNEGFITHASAPTISIDFYMHYGDDPGWFTIDYATKSVHETYVYYTFGVDAGLHVLDVGDYGVFNATYQYRLDQTTTYYLPI